MLSTSGGNKHIFIWSHKIYQFLYFIVDGLVLRKYFPTQLKISQPHNSAKIPGIIVDVLVAQHIIIVIAFLILILFIAKLS